jgi:serine protease
MRTFKKAAVRAATVISLAALGAVSLATGADARTAPSEGRTAKVQATAGRHHHGVKYQAHTVNRAAAGDGTLSLSSSNQQGVVSPAPQVYLVFWGSQWANDPAGVAPDLQSMFGGLYGGQDTWGTILNQYCEGLPQGTTTCGDQGTHVNHPTSSPLAGTWFDNSDAAPDSAAASDLAAEAAKAAEHFGNTTQDPNLNAQYVIVSPTGTHPDGFPDSGFCAWHDQTSSSYGTLAYTNLPYIPDSGAGACTTFTDGRLLSGIESTETHEYAETVTDFWPSSGWNGAQGEIGDACQNLDAYVTLSTGTFDLQGLWSNSAGGCVTQG